MSNTNNIWEDWKKRIGGIYTHAETGLLGDIRAGGGGQDIRVGGLTGRSKIYLIKADYKQLVV